MVIPCAFSVDLEDWYHGIELPMHRWDACESRVEVGLDRILDLLDGRSVRATFFTLGWIAERYPKLLRRIDAAGHELASHGYSHTKVYDLSREAFREEVRRTKRTIEDTTGTSVTAHRSPYFTITPQTLWALDILADEGYRIDCSINPVKTWRYGIATSPDVIYRIAESGITEFPVSTFRFLGRKWGIGGAYLRVAPLSFTTRALKRRVSAGVASMFYIHPWEYDPRHPSVGMEWKARLMHYYRLSSTQGATQHLLEAFHFDTVSNVVRDHQAAGRIATLSTAVLTD